MIHQKLPLADRSGTRKHSIRRGIASIGSGAPGDRVSSGDTTTRDEGFTAVLKWNEEWSTLDSFQERVKQYVVGTKKEDRLSVRTASTGTDGSRGTAVQDDSDCDHQYATYRRGWSTTSTTTTNDSDSDNNPVGLGADNAEVLVGTLSEPDFVFMEFESGMGLCGLPVWCVIAAALLAAALSGACRAAMLKCVANFFKFFKFARLADLFRDPTCTGACCKSSSTTSSRGSMWRRSLPSFTWTETDGDSFLSLEVTSRWKRFFGRCSSVRGKLPLIWVMISWILWTGELYGGKGGSSDTCTPKVGKVVVSGWREVEVGGGW